MSDPAPDSTSVKLYPEPIVPPALNVYSVTLTVTLVAPKNSTAANIQTQKQLNVLASTMGDAIAKAVAATPGGEARQCNLICVVNVQ